MSTNAHIITFKGQTLHLFPEKALYWEEEHILVISDLHFGKSGHFRKHGIPVPEDINDQNLIQLDKLILRTEASKLIFLGDIFHSEANSEILSFKKWRHRYPEADMILTLGNHDILSKQEYSDIGLQVTEQVECPPFVFMHDAEEYSSEISGNTYPIAGHIHPSLKLTGKGRQSMYTPCFYFGRTHALLPAFGTFTGTHRIHPKENEMVFAIVENTVIDLTHN